MNKEEFIKQLRKIDGVVCAARFGSYKSEYWIEGRSDIDIAIIVKPKMKFIDTLKIEDEITEKAREYYNYDNIHLTFILFNDFSSLYARLAVDSDEQYIADENNWYDFQHYVLKFARNNRQFERNLKIDEQYTYFGGIIDESLL